MTDTQVAVCAAQEWARTHAKSYYGSSIKFGTDTMNVYLAAKTACKYQGDAPAMAAALAALSVPAEALQWFEQLVAHAQAYPLGQLSPVADASAVNQ